VRIANAQPFKKMKMRSILFLISVCALFDVLGQRSYSFISPLPPESAHIHAVDAHLFGVYKADSSDIVYEFNAAGIFTRSLSIVPISRETVRETSTYRISGNYIHGIMANDSLPCVLGRDTIVSMNSKNELRKIGSGEYILNFYENGTYTPCLVRINSGKLSIHFFDYRDDQTFAAIKSQQSKQEEELTHVYLLPTIKEWKKMDSSSLFGKPAIYKLESSR
jgi:hypothetical protein